ncbi:putative DNA-binding protein with PD1-like DNA-binding motif [Halobacteroides halobius DSM 5150]|uniref:Putative DNA-binding protein with PD1-like DNA-binding motif n=1 Tax=Halobacteroides halobius (strain ATCC 35273 / DSM 5150 / MD-1) TaxID=748449 RepID=L0K9N6_HALHC|nr:PPC domain-containing DNA-binding protein [Halobacteroides halobius]AGB41084.1 putative DNA-binding protein with PD1-like DNA-binding motif [Halobacteroides halobius DSM 5150]
MLREYNVTNIYQGRLETGDDLLAELTKLVKEKGIEAGKVSAIGAVKQATLSYYDQEKQQYNEKEFNQPLEIISFLGNISLKDGEPIIHAHISLGDEEGELYGGHLASETIVFACEFIIEEYEGKPFKRGYHETTGLPLWQK